MKYIRAKDYNLILQVSDKITDKYGTYYLYDNDTRWYEDRIAKVANNIEELFDELYFVEDETNIPLRVNRLHESLDKGKKLTECCLEIGDWVTYLKKFSRKGCIKGAIFTSDGIIYVAKLNEEGEWVNMTDYYHE